MNLNDVAGSRPDFVISGFPLGDGRVGVFASKELDYAEIEVEIRAYEHFGSVEHQDIRTTLTIGMRTYTIAIGRTYSEAIANLFRTWTPDAEPQVELVGPPLALSPYEAP